MTASYTGELAGLARREKLSEMAGFAYFDGDATAA
jgi:hypothetical protein